MNAITEQIMADIRKVRYDQSYKISWMPTKSVTEGQKALESKHGTPREFAKACLELIGEISVDEFHAAITKYKNEWEAAK